MSSVAARQALCVAVCVTVLGEGGMGTNASAQGKDEQVRIFKIVLFLFSWTPLSDVQEWHCKADLLLGAVRVSVVSSGH